MRAAFSSLHFALGLIVLVLAADAVADEPEGALWLVPSPSLALRQPTRVLVTDHRISPARLEIEAGQAVTWLSYARGGSRVAFERPAGDAVTCRAFRHVNGRLVSPSLHAGQDAQSCKFAPGVYRYRILRDGVLSVPARGGRQLSTRLEGRIVVREATP